ncbi:MAG: biotin/lipoyl-binding protein [Ahrensia sp.]|nr:biotin/lipoyl-binding protein [Ahrensia sp.]
MNDIEKPRTAICKIRSDIKTLAGSRVKAGGEGWLLFDPIKNSYHKLNDNAYELLQLWPVHDDAESLVEAFHAEHGVEIDITEVTEFDRFLRHQNLAEANEGDGWHRLAAKKKHSRKSVLSQTIHSYLFFRLPLVYPNRFLEFTLPLVRPFLGRTMMSIMALLGILALYLASQRWEQIATTFVEHFTLDFLAIYIAALVGVKIVHELGHAYMTVRYGCRIPSMGVAFLLLFPVLYTDTSESWQLQDRRKRLAIDLGGIAVELYIAVLATLVWIFLPDGYLRSVMFILATTTWTLSLAINLNPFMKFDGYYVLSDLLDFENLQPRSFELGRWKLREILFRPKAECPETLSRGRRNFLIAYAWTTWLYRLVLYLGIAILVYSFTFKVLGIILFIIEIVWLIARPVWQEVSRWRALIKNHASRTRTALTFATGALAMTALFIPIQTRVSVPAILQPAKYQRIYLPRPAQVTHVHVKRGDWVNEGDILFELSSHELTRELDLINAQIAEAQADLRFKLLDPNSRHLARVANEQLALLQTQRRGKQEEIERLSIRASVDGRLVDLARGMVEGQWVAARQPVAFVFGGATEEPNDLINRASQLNGYVSASDLDRVTPGSTGTFVPEDIMMEQHPVRLVDVQINRSDTIDHPYLASTHQAAIPVRRDPAGALIIDGAYYLSRFETTSPVQIDRVHRGTVLVEAKRVSLASEAFRRISAVLVRELDI